MFFSRSSPFICLTELNVRSNVLHKNWQMISTVRPGLSLKVYSASQPLKSPWRLENFTKYLPAPRTPSAAPPRETRLPDASKVGGRKNTKWRGGQRRKREMMKEGRHEFKPRWIHFSKAAQTGPIERRLSTLKSGKHAPRCVWDGLVCEWRSLNRLFCLLLNPLHGRTSRRMNFQSEPIDFLQG